ncbi:MAG TPA: 4a-hydroxytetrahydrobiopterin dehydratase [Actinomycetota bacterium]|jgi:4a-hydroxytetrahydrobiopterin dehydratase
MTKLSEDEVNHFLSRGDLPGWRFDRGEIFKNYKFPTFIDAVDFINRVAERAEAANHHPDLENHYNRVRIGLHTWTEDGVTERDIALAREIEAALRDA